MSFIPSAQSSMVKEDIDNNFKNRIIHLEKVERILNTNNILNIELLIFLILCYWFAQPIYWQILWGDFEQFEDFFSNSITFFEIHYHIIDGIINGGIYIWEIYWLLFHDLLAITIFMLIIISRTGMMVNLRLIWPPTHLFLQALLREK